MKSTLVPTRVLTERVGVYCRISDDPRKKEEGVGRQRKDGVTLAEVRGWEVQGVYVDNDVAVLKPGAPRPEYDRLMAAVARGEVTRIVAYGLGRMFRNRSERAEAIGFLARHGVSITLVKGGEIDLTSAAGRAVAGLLGEMDTMESELKSERVARASLERAEQGRANAHVAYGWSRVYVRSETGEVLAWHDEKHPQQAAVVVRIVDMLLANISLKEVARTLNGDGITPPRQHLRATNGRTDAPRRNVADEWQGATVRRIALRWANVGIRERNRQPFADAAWPAIVDRKKHDRVVALLSSPERRTCRNGARRHLLSFGIGECGVCTSRLKRHVVRRAAKGHAPQEIYQCDKKGCVGRRQDHVDRLVGKAAIARLQLPDAVDLLTRDDTAAMEAMERAATARAKLARLQDDYDQDVIDRDMYVRGAKRHRAELAAATAESMRAVRGVDPEMLAALAGPEAAEAWTALTTSQKRALLEAMGCTVTINPTARRGPGFDPTSVVVTFGDVE